MKNSREGVNGLIETVNARAKDVPEMIELASLVFQSQMGFNFPLLFSESNAENMTLVKVDNRLVTMVGMLPRDISIFGHRVKSGLIGAVCTHPDHRGRGYGRLALDRAQEVAREKGLALLIISGVRGLYEKIGTVRPAGFFQLTVELGESAPVREASLEDTLRLLELYREKPVRYLRNRGEFEKVFQTGRVKVRPARTFLSGQAYVTVIHRKDGQDQVVEYAGNESEVLAAISGFLELSGKRECELVVDRYFKGDKLMNYEFEGTAKVISPQNFIEQLKGYFSEMLSREEFENFSELAKRSSSAQFTKVVFSNSKIGVLPLPLPDYGFDYI